jgi:hypothetical protein
MPRCKPVKGSPDIFVLLQMRAFSSLTVRLTFLSISSQYLSFTSPDCEPRCFPTPPPMASPGTILARGQNTRRSELLDDIRLDSRRPPQTHRKSHDRQVAGSSH